MGNSKSQKMPGEKDLATIENHYELLEIRAGGEAEEVRIYRSNTRSRKKYFAKMYSMPNEHSFEKFKRRLEERMRMDVGRVVTVLDYFGNKRS